MLRHEEPREVGGGAVDPRVLERLPRDADADGHVLTLPRLADVVQERGEQDGVTVVDRLGRLRRERIVARVVEQRRRAGEALEQVHVHRRSVIRIALRTAPDVAPRRQVPLEQADAVECLERTRRIRAAAEQLEERVPDLDRPRRPGRDDVGRHRVERRGGHHPALADDGDERAQDALGRRLDLRQRRRPAQVPVERGRDDVLELPPVLEHRSHEAVDRGRPGSSTNPMPAAIGACCSRTSRFEPRPLQVERTPDADEDLLGLGDRPPLGRAHDPRLLERRADGQLQPSERLRVPESASALLHVRLEQRRHRSEPFAAGLTIVDQAGGEGAGIGALGLEDAGVGRGPRGPVPGEEPAVEHRGRCVQPGRGLDALGRGAHGVAYAQPASHNGYRRRSARAPAPRRLRAVVQDQQVDV